MTKPEELEIVNNNIKDTKKNTGRISEEKYVIAICRLVPWINKQIDISDDKVIIIKMKDISKEMGTEFEHRSQGSIYNNIKIALFREGIMSNIATHANGEKVIVMRHVLPGDNPTWKGFGSRAEHLEHFAKEKGFKSHTEYKKHLMKERGFGSRAEYEEHLAKEKGFKSYSEYLEHSIKEKGFGSRTEYEEHLVKEKGFESRAEYLEYFAKEKGFKSHTEYKEHLIKERGFGSRTDYQEHLANEKGFGSYTVYKEHLIKERGFESRTEYEEHLAKKKGFESHAEYKEHFAKEKGFESYAEYKRHIDSKRTCKYLQKKVAGNNDPNSIFSDVESLRNLTGCKIPTTDKKGTERYNINITLGKHKFIMVTMQNPENLKEDMSFYISKGYYRHEGYDGSEFIWPDIENANSLNRCIIEKIDVAESYIKEIESAEANVLSIRKLKRMMHDIDNEICNTIAIATESMVPIRRYYSNPMVVSLLDLS